MLEPAYFGYWWTRSYASHYDLVVLFMYAQRGRMAKGYWVTFYRSVSDSNAVVEYAKLAGPAIQAGGGRFLARGGVVKTYENGMNLRTVVTEFDSVEKAIATFESPAYQAALKILGGAADRDIRIIEGL
ncbi:MAG TPA: DUF1330 domain-containing protein [Candidatus Acidoferrales bacterium]|nr:DUF1330 domain-containing protein [Candidatus Acidoferrales bacterium]